MQGKVKWFSEEKGYGFVTDDTLTDRHFGVRDVIGSELPKVGAIVEFESATGDKGLRAKKVAIISQTSAPAAAISAQTSSSNRDDRETCKSCNKKMVPRIITYRGNVQRSVCPFCGTTHKKFTSNIIWWILLALFIYPLFILIFSK